jgi:hypothetical protein
VDSLLWIFILSKIIKLIIFEIQGYYLKIKENVA